jgi:hypothetical protein
MADAYISYFGGSIEGGEVQVPDNRIGTAKVAIGGTSARTSSDIPAGTKFIKIKADGACHFNLGDDSVTATTSNDYIEADGVVFEGVDGAERVAVIEKA